jgi:2-oxoglutarate ferredoxin oxidoreductase subunit beta
MNSMARALEKVNASLEKTVIVSGIGCWGHVDSYFKTNAFHGTHGRALAFATGIKLSNPELTVIVVMGDGDGATIGGNHLIHACRRNIDVTAIVCNNYNYGMTGGQYSGTTPEDSITTTSRLGHIEHGFDLSALAIVSGAPFVARTISENVLQNADLIAQAITKKGFSFIEVISPCTTHYGNNNNMRRPSELYRWIKSNAVPVAAAANLPPEKLVGKFTIGKLHEHEAIDYSTRYLEVQAKAKALAK